MTFGEFGGATSDKGPDFVTKDLEAEDIQIDLGSAIKGPFLAMVTGLITSVLVFLLEMFNFILKYSLK